VEVKAAARVTPFDAQGLEAFLDEYAGAAEQRPRYDFFAPTSGTDVATIVKKTISLPTDLARERQQTRVPTRGLGGSLRRNAVWDWLAWSA